MELPTAGEVQTEVPLGEGSIKVVVTEKAWEKIQLFSQGSQNEAGKHFRVYVQGGGCSGFQYGFNFDDKRDDDLVLSQGDVDLLIDPVSAPYLNNSVLDYTESLAGSGFAVKNPNAKSTCGCGVSFSV